jgi:hypothetical protein
MLESISTDSESLDAVDEDDGSQWESGENHIFLVDCSYSFLKMSEIEQSGEDEAEHGNIPEEIEEWDEEGGNETSWRIRGATVIDLYVNLLGQRQKYRHEEEGFYWLP